MEENIQRDKKKWLDKKAEGAKEITIFNHMQAIYQTTKKISGSVQTSSGPMKTKDDMLLSKDKDKIAR